MNEKKQKIIEVAMVLFSEKGYHATSIQEVADRSNISKGAVYLHFASKDDIILSIFKYYYETMRDHILTNEEEDGLSPVASFINQLLAYFKEMISYKDFIRMQFREQALTFNKDIKQIMINIHKDTHEWYKRNLIKIYGEAIKPYLYDATLIVEGILHAYLKLILINKIQVNLEKLSHFIYERMNDLITTMINKRTTPMITRDPLANIYSPEQDDIENTEKDLMKIQQLIEHLTISVNEKKQLQETIDFLLEEIKKNNIKGFILKGMLNNLSDISEFKPIVDRIAKRHEIRKAKTTI